MEQADNLDSFDHLDQLSVHGRSGLFSPRSIHEFSFARIAALKDATGEPCESELTHPFLQDEFALPPILTAELEAE